MFGRGRREYVHGLEQQIIDLEASPAYQIGQAVMELLHNADEFQKALDAASPPQIDTLSKGLADLALGFVEQNPGPDNYRLRALQLGGQSRRTGGILELNALCVNDPLTIVFTDRGRGNEPKDTSGHWPDSPAERRRLRGILVNPETGLFTVSVDQWHQKHAKKGCQLESGQRVLLRTRGVAPNENDQPFPGITKNRPLFILNSVGRLLSYDSDVVVHYAKLGRGKEKYELLPLPRTRRY